MDIISSILELPKQCRQAWREALTVDLPQDWDIKNIVICGMGGSALGAHTLQVSGSVKVPMVINNNYFLPSFASEESLVVLASYSGNTEEVLSCAKDAIEKGCKIIGITSGGKLAERLNSNNIHAYIFDPKFNSTKQPRMGIGYNIFGVSAIFHNLGLFNGNDTEDVVENAINILEDNLEQIKSDAQDIAKKLTGKFPVIFASDYLVGNAHIFANQLNETAKSFSAYYSLPEANHHLLEGLKHPKIPAVAIFLGKHYPERILERFKITQEILEKNGWEVLSWSTDQEDQFTQSIQTLLFSSLVTAYLGLEYDEDTISISTVDYFKAKLG
ncbi:MAG: glucose/mannose-6-phosphate isomerase [Microgenomates group bacterium Gr01-1014_5]|nr:MAG: glucose/mannose-6-phosphate isomerase [Microgenomates group bacterium Gr01-1014_5]